MLSSPVPQWIAAFRWLLAVLRRGTPKLPLGLTHVVSFLQTAIQRLRWMPLSCARSQDNVNDLGFLSCASDSVPAGYGMQILEQPRAIGGFDVAAPGDSGSDSPEKDSEAFTAPDVKSSCDSQPEPSGARETTVATPASYSSCAPRISDIRLILPENFARYKYRETEPKEAEPYKVGAQTLTFAPGDPPSGWIAPLHPEGAKYYCDTQRRIFTDLNICDPRNLANLNQVVEHIVEQIRASGSNGNLHYAALLGEAQDPDLLVDLVIDMDDNKMKPTQGFYYFINHSERCPFWLDSFFPAQELRLWDGIQLTMEMQTEQLRHAMEHQFWQHCALFPNTLHLSERRTKELADCIIFAIGDLSTSFTSTVPQTIEELKTWLSVVKHLQPNPVASQGALLHDGLGSAFTFARMMEQFAQGRFDNFHGLPWARLNHDQSVFKKEEHTESYFARVIALALFFTPAVYLHSLKKAYVDRRVMMRVWKPLIHKLNTEWTDFILIGTVILNANVAFLSIASVDTLTNGRHSLVQIFSYLSIVASMGSVILALLLVRQNRTKFHESASDLSASLHVRIRETGGLNLLAIIFSLPYALLIWSTILFFAAFLTTCLRVPDTISRSTICVAVVIVSVCILWCIWDAWPMGVSSPESVKAEVEEEDALGAPFGHRLLSFSTRISTIKLKERFVQIPDPHPV
ncbi:hypothetical protein DFH07DRAFT_968958 [Mycena maculata]|uniref:Uncharacterized protein n=1 Tax=Mycena maculata TaxID=230809 RepID=A0AAD7HZ52_9AGAR|nr:hypothetical protein DFH07DRAFT_968958 [Mycena maculata]